MRHDKETRPCCELNIRRQKEEYRAFQMSHVKTKTKHRDVDNRLDLMHECLSGGMIGAERLKKWRLWEKE
jgi:hypothetical protein